jgi:chromate reductase
MATHTIVTIVGSLRKESFSLKIANALAKLAPASLKLDVTTLESISFFNQDLEAAPPADWLAFREKLQKSNGVLFVTPEYNRSIPGVLKNAIDVGSRPYGQSVWDRKPAAIVTASPGAIGGALSNHQIRQSCVFLNMPVMQQPEAYLGQVSDDSFDDGGCLKEGPLKDVVVKLAHAFHDWVEMIHRSRQLLAEDSAHAAAREKEHA